MTENRPLVQAANAADVEKFSAGSGHRIYRIRHQALPHLAGYVHLILGDSGFPPTLVDAGSGEGTSFSDILAGIDYIRTEYKESISADTVKTLIISHAHIDHFGGASRWRQLANPQICAHLYDAKVIESFNERAAVANAAYEDLLIRSGVDESRIGSILTAFGFLPGRARSVKVDRRLEEGEMVNGLQIFHFPGHCAGQIGIRVGEYLLTGDLILSKTLTQNWPESVFPCCGFLRSLESMKKLETICSAEDAPTLLLPAHEATIPRVRQRIQMIQNAEKRRNDRLLALLDRSEEGMTINELAGKMYLTAHLNRTFFAICDVASRVEYLRLCGFISAANYDILAAGGRALRWRV